jgi:hypothetical protein
MARLIELSDFVASMRESLFYRGQERGEVDALSQKDWGAAVGMSYRETYRAA